MNMELGLVYSQISFETKELMRAAAEEGMALAKINDNELQLSLGENTPTFPQCTLMRSISHSHGLYVSEYIEYLQKTSINSAAAIRICGDKALCSMHLAKARIPSPKTFLSFSSQMAQSAMDSLSYPCVVKPVIGSWGRLVHKINDSDAARAVLEYKEHLSNPMHKVYYTQAYVEKPGRDIRAFMCGGEIAGAIYRTSENGDFRTNHHLGSCVSPCPVSSELSDICGHVAQLFGNEQILGIDLIESSEGLLVVEVNSTPEFAGCQKATGIDIAKKTVQHAMRIAKN